jgi:hypothetical protein
MWSLEWPRWGSVPRVGGNREPKGRRLRLRARLWEAVETVMYRPSTSGSLDRALTHFSFGSTGV